MDIDNEILKSILLYNSKELQKGSIYSKGGKSLQEVQKLHYLDDQGAITFSIGACVNTFTLPKPIKILVNNKIVKLFKLFEEETVHFVLGYDAISDDIIQTKIRLETPTTSITAILNCDNSLLNKVPVKRIREMADSVYTYSISFNKNLLAQAINRMLTFTKLSAKSVAYFTFTEDKLVISDINQENSETLLIKGYDGEETSILLDLNDMKLTLDSCTEPYVTLSFGGENDRSVLLTRLNVSNILPICELN